jgi:hypothetical protein
MLSLYSDNIRKVYISLKIGLFMNLIEQLRLKAQEFSARIERVSKEYSDELRQEPIEDNHYSQITSNLMTLISTAPDILAREDVAQDILPVYSMVEADLVSYLNKVQSNPGFAFNQLFTKYHVSENGTTEVLA